MGEKSDKVWGTTECLLETPFVQLHRIRFLKGGVCSWHQHEHRWNSFYAISGELMVSAQGDNVDSDSMDAFLRAGSFFSVEPGVTHRFEGLTDGVALELYWPAELSLTDIKRFSKGFLRG